MNGSSASASYSIIDALGRVVSNGLIDHGTVNTRALPCAAYHLVVRTPASVRSWKFMKE